MRIVEESMEIDLNEVCDRNKVKWWSDWATYWVLITGTALSINTYESLLVKALLDSGTAGMFIDIEFAKKNGFRIQKLEKLMLVRNINEKANVREVITYEVEVNMFFKNYIERIKIDVYNLGKIEVISGMPL